MDTPTYGYSDTHVHTQSHTSRTHTPTPTHSHTHSQTQRLFISGRADVEAAGRPLPLLEMITALSERIITTHTHTHTHTLTHTLSQSIHTYSRQAETQAKPLKKDFFRTNTHRLKRIIAEPTHTHSNRSSLHQHTRTCTLAKR